MRIQNVHIRKGSIQNWYMLIHMYVATPSCAMCVHAQEQHSLYTARILRKAHMHDTSSYKCWEHEQKTSHHTQPLALVYRGYSQKFSYTIPSAITSVMESTTFKNSVLSAPSYCANTPPYQCFSAASHISNGMQSQSNFNNYYQTVIHIQVHSN